MTRVLPPDGAAVRNASLAATELIKRAIVDGALEPGRRLKEVELAREFGISRTPIREALATLQAQELVASAPRRGAYVRVRDADDLDDLYSLRALLEGHAARRAAEHASPHGIRLLRASCLRFEAHEQRDMHALVAENLFFHNTILDLARSARLAALVRRVIEVPLVYNAYRWYRPVERRAAVDYHRRIADAIAAGDTDGAERAMRDHVLTARDVLVAKHRAGGPG